MNTRFINLAFGCLFLVFLATRFAGDGRERLVLEREQHVSAARADALRLLNRLKGTSTREGQIQSLLVEFRQILFPATVELTQGRMSPRAFALECERLRRKNLVARGFPRHDLEIIYHDSFRSFPLFSHSEGLGNIGLVTRILTDYLHSGDRGDADPQASLARFRKGFDYPVPLSHQGSMRQQILQVFNTTSGISGLYWDRIPRNHRDMTIYIVAKMDLSRRDPWFGIRALVKREIKPGWGIAFLPRVGKNSHPLYSGLFRTESGLRDRLFDVAHGFGRFAAEEMKEKFLLLSSPVDGLNADLIVARRLPLPEELESPRMAALRFLLIGFFTAFGLVLFGERLVFDRGPRLRIGIILLGACLIIELLPIAEMRGLLRKTLAEELAKNRQEEARLLHRQLQRLDEGVRSLQAETFENIRQVGRNPDSFELIRTLENNPRMKPFALEDLSGKIQPKFDHGDRRTAELVVVAGPGTFERGWGTTSNRTGQAPDMMLRLFAPFSRNLLYQWNPALKPRGKTDTAAVFRKPGASEISYAVQQEVVMDVLLAIIGPEAFCNLIGNSDRIIEVNTTYVSIYLTFLKIMHDRTARYTTMMIWSDWLIAGNYLLERLDYNTELVSPTKPRGVGEGATDKTRLSWESDGRTRFVSTPMIPSEKHLFHGIRGIPEKTGILRLLDQTREAGFPQTAFAPRTPGKPLMETLPGGYLRKSIIAGYRPTDHLEARNDRSLRLFDLFQLGALLLALLLARLGQTRVMKPLKALLTAIHRINADDFSARLDAERPDEFGSLGKAFNAMARGLEEGKLLGKYVSASVRRAVEDERFGEVARRGQVRDVTILFSSLVGFDEYQETHSLGETFGLIERHLDAFTKAITAHGGEIDKTIGEKILVTFDHESLGGGESAIDVVLAVIRDVRAAMDGAPLPTAMGVNSGSVIAGILGASSVRLDFTVIGDVVNLASRLSTLAHITEGTRIVLAGATTALAGTKIRTQKLPFKRVKGKTHEVEAYLLLD
ncbi:MAG: adenylate/guanylate cyclase domain-containing protein [Candidatus Ozemobacteraceae bacterium]